MKPTKFIRQYKIDNKWSKSDTFLYPADLYIETMDMWNCEDFSMELLAWCEQAQPGDVFEDDDIRVTVK